MKLSVAQGNQIVNKLCNVFPRRYLIYLQFRTIFCLQNKTIWQTIFKAWYSQDWICLFVRIFLLPMYCILLNKGAGRRGRKRILILVWVKPTMFHPHYFSYKAWKFDYDRLVLPEIWPAKFKSQGHIYLGRLAHSAKYSGFDRPEYSTWHQWFRQAPHYFFPGVQLGA